MHPSSLSAAGCAAPLRGLAVTFAVLLAWPWGATAQPAAVEKPTAPVATISRTAAEVPRAPLPEQVTVIEDDGARIEETRRRGQVVRVQVQSKVGNARSYDIVLKPGAEPASQQRGAAGRSAWPLFSF